MVQYSESQNVLKQLKTEAIDSWPTPTATSETELRSFLGLAGYYRRMVPGFSKIAAPLNALLGGTKTRTIRIPDQKKILDSSVYIFVNFVNQRKPECQELLDLLTSGRGLVDLMNSISVYRDGRHLAGKIVR